MTDTTPNPDPEGDETPPDPVDAPGEHRTRDDREPTPDPGTTYEPGHVRRDDDPPPADDPDVEPSHEPAARRGDDDDADTEGGET